MGAKSIMRGVAFVVLLSCGSSSERAAQPSSTCDTSEMGDLGAASFHRSGRSFAVGTRAGALLGVPLGKPAIKGNLVSLSPDVMEVVVESGTPILVAKAPGTAKIEVRGEGSVLVDARTYRVAEVAKLTLSRVDDLVFEGGTAGVSVSGTDGTGCPMVLIGGGVHYSLEGLAVTSLPGTSAASGLGSSYDEGSGFTAGAPGAGTLVVRAANGVSVSTAITVTNVAASITVKAGASPLRAGPGVTYGVNAKAFAEDGRAIADPKCTTWTLAPPDGPITMSPGRASASVKSIVPATASITCTIGTTSGSGDITFE